MDLTNQKVLVIGSGISGVGAVSLLHRIGAKPVMLDENETITEEQVRAKLHEEDRDVCEIITGAFPAERVSDFAVCVPSPAVPFDTKTMLLLQEHQVPIWSEIELAFRYGKGSLVGITGTNGKTTTTTLVGEIMKARFEDVHVVGNIGYAYTEETALMKEESVSVAEISSFQLEAVDAFHAKVSAILNITPDHLNRHHTMECYAQMKYNVCINQTRDDVCVLNYDNDWTRTFGEKECPARVVFFSTHEKLGDGLYLDGEDIMLAEAGTAERLMNIHDMRLVGLCNVENVMAAIGISRAMGVPMETILAVVRDFRAVEHRIEFVATKGGVDYYNDSKGTNPDAAIQGIRAMSRPTILIGGGYDKGSTYDEWIDAFDGKVKELVLIGQTRDKIAECARAHGFTNITMFDTYEECLQHCTQAAEDGDAVLLSPACASWGMFPNYEERGRQFKAYVNGLAD